MAKLNEVIVPSVPHTNGQPHGLLYHARPPVHRVPDDLLFCIFQHLSGCFTNEDGGADADFALGLFTASYVCKRWRYVALSLPYLWTQIAFQPGRLDSSKEMHLACQRADLQLARSASLPLRMVIRISNEWVDPDLACDPDNDARRVEETVRNLLQHIHRCQSLQFIGYLPEHWNVFVEDKTCAQLEMLVAMPSNWFEREFPADTPVLKHLELFHARSNSGLPIPQSWKNLHTLRLAKCISPLMMLLEAISIAAGSLRSLKIQGDIIIEEGSPYTTFAATKLPHLRKMKLSLSEFPLQHVLSQLCAPALLQLHLTWQDHMHNQELEIGNLLATQAFVRASGIGSTLRELRLHSVLPSTDDALISLLSDLSALKKFSVGRSYSDRAFPSNVLLALRWPEPAPAHAVARLGSLTPEQQALVNMKICPSLTQLNIRGAEQYPSLLILMLRSRARGRASGGEGEEGTSASLKWVGLGCNLYRLTEEPQLNWLTGAVRNGVIGLVVD